MIAKVCCDDSFLRNLAKGKGCYEQPSMFLRWGGVCRSELAPGFKCVVLRFPQKSGEMLSSSGRAGGLGGLLWLSVLPKTASLWLEGRGDKDATVCNSTEPRLLPGESRLRLRGMFCWG
jgi:hypothetical protein